MYTSRYARRKASWRNILIAQPPPTEVSFVYFCWPMEKNGESIIVIPGQEATLGRIFDTIEELRPPHIPHSVVRIGIEVKYPYIEGSDQTVCWSSLVYRV